MGRFAVLALAVVALAACKKESSNEGLPPAKDWSGSVGDLPPVQQQGRANPHAGGANPHAGLNMGGADDPHAGLDMNGDNPHAGLDMGGDGSDPHAGLDMSGGNPHGGGSPDVTQLGLAAPDPNRKIDPAHHVTGVIKVHPKAKSRVAAGGAVFLIVKKAGPDGQPTGTPVAVDKLTWADKDEIPFEVSEKNAMVAGTELSGDVVVTARYDQDGDALSKQPGDIVGTSKVKIPADKVVVTLDDVLN